MNAQSIITAALFAITAASIGIAFNEHQAAQKAAMEAAQQPSRIYLASMEAQLIAAKRDIAYARNHAQTLQTEFDDLRAQSRQ